MKRQGRYRRKLSLPGQGQTASLPVPRCQPDPTEHGSPLLYFGRRPSVETGLPLIERPVPIGQVCRDCVEEITETDRGYLHVSEQTGDLEPMHLECDVLAGLAAVAYVEQFLDGPYFGDVPTIMPQPGRHRQRARLALAGINARRFALGLGPL